MHAWSGVQSQWSRDCPTNTDPRPCGNSDMCHNSRYLNHGDGFADDMKQREKNWNAASPLPILCHVTISHRTLTRSAANTLSSIPEFVTQNPTFPKFQWGLALKIQGTEPLHSHLQPENISLITLSLRDSTLTQQQNSPRFAIRGHSGWVLLGRRHCPPRARRTSSSPAPCLMSTTSRILATLLAVFW
jgi:hypothetical protein